jgi:hypothetical protein
LATAAGLSVVACHRFVVYLVAGGLANVSIAALAVVIAPCLLAFSWWSLTATPLPEVRSAALRLLERAGPNAYLLVLAIAWTDGAIGLAGFGPIRPGWLTATGSAALVLAFVIAKRRPGETTGEAAV